MFCESCGNKLNEKDKFCSNCGMHITNNDDSSNNINKYEQQNTSSNDDKLGLVSVVLGVISIVTIFCRNLSGIILAIIGLVLGIATKNKDKNKIIGIILNAGILVFLIINIIFYIRGLQYLLTP